MKLFTHITLSVLFLFLITFYNESLCQDLAYNSLPLIYLNIETKNGNPKLQQHIENILKSEIAKQIHIQPIQTENNNSQIPNTIETVSDYKNDSIKCEGSISINEYKIGEEQLSKYVIKDIVKQEFFIDINISVNDQTTSIQKSFSDIALLDVTLCQISKDIAAFYTQHKTQPIQQPIQTTSQSNSEQVFTNLNYMTLRSISSSIFYAQPIGRYATVVDYGYGANVSAQYTIPYYINYIEFSIAALTYNPKTNSIERYSATMLSCSLGYDYNFINQFTISMSVGGSYFISVINGANNISVTDNNYDNKIYYNPAITTGITLYHKIFNNLNIMINSSYILFFERESTGNFITIGAGVSMIL